MSAHGAKARERGAGDGADASRARALAAEYLAYLSEVRGLSPHTVRAYGSDIDAYLRWCERKGVFALAATAPDIRAWLGELRRARYAPRTMNRKLSAVCGLYGWLAERGQASQAAVASQHGPKTGRHLPKVMGDADVGRLLEAAAGEEGEWAVFDRALVELLYATGARIQEASNLDLDDIDLVHGRATLFGKGSKERIVPVYRKATEALRAYLEGVRPARAARSTGAGEGALFLSTRGNRMSAAALRKRVKGLVAMAGLPQSVSPHTLRHTFATELLNGDADLRSVQELLGHASLSTTQIYTNLSVERLRDVMDRAHPRGTDGDS